MVHEVRDVDDLCAFYRDLTEIVVRDLDIFALLILIAFHDLIASYFLIVQLAYSLIPNSAVIWLVKEVKVDPLAAGCRIDRDRDAYEAKLNRPAPNRSHLDIPPDVIVAFTQSGE